MPTIIKFSFYPIGAKTPHTYFIADKSGNVSGEYVPLAEYEALRQELERTQANLKTVTQNLATSLPIAPPETIVEKAVIVMLQAIRQSK